MSGQKPEQPRLMAATTLGPEILPTPENRPQTGEKIVKKISNDRASLEKKRTYKSIEQVAEKPQEIGEIINLTVADQAADAWILFFTYPQLIVH
jgi:hypothetical protein